MGGAPREKHCAAPQTFENLEHNCLNYSAFPRRRQAPHCTHELPDPGYAVAKEPRHVQHCRKPRGRPSPRSIPRTISPAWLSSYCGNSCRRRSRSVCSGFPFRGSANRESKTTINCRSSWITQACPHKRAMSAYWGFGRHSSRPRECPQVTPSRSRTRTAVASRVLGLFGQRERPHESSRRRTRQATPTPGRPEKAHTS